MRANTDLLNLRVHSDIHILMYPVLPHSPISLPTTLVGLVSQVFALQWLLSSTVLQQMDAEVIVVRAWNSISHPQATVRARSPCLKGQILAITCYTWYLTLSHCCTRTESLVNMGFQTSEFFSFKKVIFKIVSCHDICYNDLAIFSMNNGMIEAWINNSNSILFYQSCNLIKIYIKFMKSNYPAIRSYWLLNFLWLDLFNMMLYFLFFSNGNFVSNLFTLSKYKYMYHTCTRNHSCMTSILCIWAK